MTGFAEHMVEHVLPIVPVRQWVLTVPHRLRYRMAYDHDVCRAVHRAFTRSLQMSYRQRAATAGISQGTTGAVTCIQRFGSALNLNVHFHTQALDGVFQEASDGRLAFFVLAAPSEEQVREVLEDLICRLQPILRRFGLQAEDDQEGDPLAGQAEALAALYAASVTGRAAFGPRSGRTPDREQLLRYCARPAISHEGLKLWTMVAFSSSSRRRASTARHTWCSRRTSSSNGWWQSSLVRRRT